MGQETELTAGQAGVGPVPVGPVPVVLDDEVREADASRLLLAAHARPALARLAALAARLLRAPSAQISLLTDVQTVAAGSGLPGGAVGGSGPLEESLCTVTARTGATLTVADATVDERVSALPPVTSGQVGAYLGAPLRTAAGRIIGVLCVFDPAVRGWTASDVTVVEVLAESVMAELELSALSDDFEYGELRWDVARDAAELGSFDVEVASGDLALDERMAAIYGLPPGTTVVNRATVLEHLHPDDRPAVEAAYTEALRSAGDYRVDYRIVRPTGEIRWVTVRGRVRTDRHGRAVQLVGVAYDTTDNRRAERAALEVAEEERRRAVAMQQVAEAAAVRLTLLADVGAELSGTLDAEEAVARLARLVVPALADWSIVSVLDDDGSLRDLGTWHADASMRPVVEQLAASRFVARRGPGPVQRAIATGEVVEVRSGVTDRAAELLGPSPALDAMLLLAPTSSIVVPLVARGRVVGALSLCRGADRAPMSDAAIVTAQQVAERAAMALDNARLYTQQRSLAEHLQRSLLTDPPEPDHLHIVVRYVPAASGASVGGDWYDSFLQDDGATVLVIGDVVGHDSHAAAAMGQLRGLLRGIAWSSGESPASVLSSLDSAISGLGLATAASAVVARVEQPEDQREDGTRTLRWSNAGHPPPLVLHPDATVTVLGGAEPELLLGIDRACRRSDRTLVLEEGTTVILYTDGLVERRTEHLDAGIGRLRDVLADLAGVPLPELCDALLGRLIDGRPEDDVALVALRLHPQDRPRPAEAGPTVLPPGVAEE